MTIAIIWLFLYAFILKVAKIKECAIGVARVLGGIAYNNGNVAQVPISKLGTTSFKLF